MASLGYVDGFPVSMRLNICSNPSCISLRRDGICLAMSSREAVSEGLQINKYISTNMCTKDPGLFTTRSLALISCVKQNPVTKFHN